MSLYRSSPSRRSFLTGSNRNRESYPPWFYQGLRGFWPLQEASGNAIDYSGRAAHGTDTNTVTQNPGTGRVPWARQFTSASSEWFSVSNALIGSIGDIPFTLQAWVYFTNSTDHIIIDKYSGGNGVTWSMSSFYSGKLNFDIYSGGVLRGSCVTAAAVPITTWTHCVAWHDPDANTVNQITNGVLATAATTAGNADSGAALGIGARTAGAIFHNGRIFNASVHARILTRQEIAWCYNSGLAQLGTRIIDRTP